ncbi:MAG: hypothetical protein EBS05_18975 [Proteobacteria bacterium]|nr:hypothetical protein [Pseudomonadota bacterium]
MIVMMFSAIALMALTAAMNWTGQNSMHNERSVQLTVTAAAAEAATEMALSRMMNDYGNSGESAVYNNLAQYRTSIPGAAHGSYWANFSFSDGQGGPNQNYVVRTQTQIYTNLSGQYAGLLGFASQYRILANARQLNGRYAIANGVSQDVQLASVPVFQFAVFYNSLLEFSTAAPLVVGGRVHANGEIYVGSGSPLTFVTNVTTTRSISDPAWAGQGGGGGWGGTVAYQGVVSTNANSLTLPIGTNNAASAVREVIYQPPPGESQSTPMGQERYYNKAELVVLVSNVTVTVMVKGTYDPSPVSIPWTNASYFITTNLTFTDQREGKTIRTTEIDVGRFGTWAATNAWVIAKLGTGNPPNILYVADNRTATSSQLTGVRLKNGRTLPSQGLTVATPNPIYVLGHYNCINNAQLGTSDTSSTRPASLVADACTILSPAWSDAASNRSYTTRVATSTTVNAAVLAGVVYSTGSAQSQFSGGAHNFPRLLEAWSGRTLTLNGSIVNLFNSVRASTQFSWPGAYYDAPTRQFYFDNNFNNPNLIPPGTPQLRVLIRARWLNPPAGVINYNG